MLYDFNFRYKNLNSDTKCGVYLLYKQMMMMMVMIHPRYRPSQRRVAATTWFFS